ncbi:MAG: M48 family metallopeptidase [Proteobacteria bacterium]|nr:M48 family metallopeptidase [Pseudomonadota bacterium]
MDFFEHQEKAKKNTFKLLLLYVLCILLIIVFTYPFLLFFTLKENLVIYFQTCSNYNFRLNACTPLIRPDVFIQTAIGISILVIVGAIFKLLGLMQGGSHIATSVGGRLVDRNTNDPLERKLLNIVEEMALASGISVPDTYVLDHEMAINAFAAGFSPKDAVVAVTRGTLENLNRDELQGVMGHEFSHILNGDMRLNIRLIALLNGILVVAILGRIILDLTTRSTRHHSYSYRSDRDSRDNSSPLGPLLALGLGLYLLGYLGVFFASLIKSAVSRQREFLADASAVQFTRNPDGLASALGRIGGYTHGSKVRTARAEEVSHMFFADGYTSILHFLFATHPPLEERIRRIGPNFAAELLPPQNQASAEFSQGSQQYAAFAGASPSKTYAGSEIVSKIGQFGEQEIAAAKQVMGNIPTSLQAMTREIASAQALLMALLLNKSGAARDKQLALSEERGFSQLVLVAEKLLSEFDKSKYLHLVELSVPTIKILPPSFIERLISDLRFFAEADSELTLFEYTVVVIIQASTRFIRGEVLPRQSCQDINQFRDDIEVLLSAVAYSGDNKGGNINQAFTAAAQSLNLDITLQSEGVCTLPKIDRALLNLVTLEPMLKRDLISAIVLAIQLDQVITEQEAQLLRAICYLLDCPLPMM